MDYQIPKGCEADVKRLENLSEQAIIHALKSGASAAEVMVSLSEGLMAKARMGEVETLEHFRDSALSMTVYKGQSRASVSSSDFSEESIMQSAKAACQIASHTSEDEYSGLPDSGLLATEQPDLDLYHPWALTAEQAIERAVCTEQAAFSVDQRIKNSGGARVNRHQNLALYRTSDGFCGLRPSTTHSTSCSVIAGEGSHMQREHWSSTSRLSELLESPQTIGEMAAMRAVARLGAKSVKTGEYPVLFSKEMTRGLLSHFISAISGGALYRRNSFLLDQLGQRVFSEQVQISENPLILQALGSASFDGDGLPRVARNIVTDGLLNGYVLSVYSARRLNMQSTANAGGVRNLVMNIGAYSEGDLLKEMDTGLYVTEMMGQGVNIGTGDYSRGAAGFWVENGEIAFPVQEVTVAGNLLTMFKDIIGVGDELDCRGNIHCPHVLIKSMMVAGS